MNPNNDVELIEDPPEFDYYWDDEELEGRVQVRHKDGEPYCDKDDYYDYYPEDDDGVDYDEEY